MIGPLTETDAWSKSKTKVDLLFALRKDTESKYSASRNENYIRSMLDSNTITKDLTFKLVDWDSASDFINMSITDPIGPDFIYKVIN